MGKQHDTFPDEQPEMPQREQKPEVNEPADPKVREIPKEDPQIIPDELPPSAPREDPGVI